MRSRPREVLPGAAPPLSFISTPPNPADPTRAAAPASPSPSEGDSLGARSIRGIAWLMMQTLGGKAVGLAGQIVLAWLLSPGDFGLIGLAYTVSSMVGMLNNFGIEQVLIHRQRRFARWANAAFWMSMALGVLSAVVMVVLAPLTARMYHEPRLTGLLLVLAISALVGNLIIVPRAKIQAELRFRFMALSGFVQALVMTGLTVLFAWWGFAAYSFVLPTPLVALGMAGWYWWAAPSRLQQRWQWRRWRFLFGDSVMLFLAGLCAIATSQGDYFILGLLYASEVVGIYYFSFNLSVQVILLFTANLASVLFPVLSKLNADPARQVAAFMRSIRLLGLVAIPICLLQAALAGPVVHLLFDARWQSSVPVVQLLSLAMAVRVVSWPASSMLMAQGRFATRLRLSVFFAALFFPLVLIGAWWDAAVGVAAAVVIYYLIGVPVNLYVALRPGGIGLPGVLRLFVPALLIGAVSMACGYGACAWMKAYPWGEAGQIAGISVIGLGIYAALMRTTEPEVLGELIERIMGLCSGIRMK